MKLRKDIRKLLDEFPNITVDRVEKVKHWKIYLTTPKGKQVLVVSDTASDHRAMLNNRTLLRKWI